MCGENLVLCHSVKGPTKLSLRGLGGPALCSPQVLLLLPCPLCISRTACMDPPLFQSGRIGLVPWAQAASPCCCALWSHLGLALTCSALF